jgi:uncharacterized coiled-coil DUF342 family protein
MAERKAMQLGKNYETCQIDSTDDSIQIHKHCVLDRRIRELQTDTRGKLMTEADQINELAFTVQELSEQVESLQQELALCSASHGDGGQFKELLAASQAKVKAMAAELDAVRSMRDSLMAENGELKKQCKSYMSALRKVA